MARLADTDLLFALLLWLLFVAGCIGSLSIGLIEQGGYRALAALSVMVVLLTTGASFYGFRWQPRALRSHIRGLALVCLYILLLAGARLGSLSSQEAVWGPSWGTGTAVLVAIVLAIAYDQRFAMGMSALYCILAVLAVGPRPDQGLPLQGVGLFLAMFAGAAVSCFSLQEIRTRMKLLEVSALTATAVFVTALSAVYLNFRGEPPTWMIVLEGAGYHAAAAFLAGLLIQSLLPLIERVFHIATSMTLLDYSDANQPLLKKMAMEAPGRSATACSSDRLPKQRRMQSTATGCSAASERTTTISARSTSPSISRKMRWARPVGTRSCRRR